MVMERICSVIIRSFSTLISPLSSLVGFPSLKKIKSFKKIAMKRERRKKRLKLFSFIFFKKKKKKKKKKKRKIIRKKGIIGGTQFADFVR